MFDRYNLSMSRQRQLMMDWSKQYLMTAWELERNVRIANVVVGCSLGFG